MTPKFFRTSADFRKWLQQHHRSAAELVVGFHKMSSGRPSITWPESVEAALCFGWSDGVRCSLDAESYCVRFTPRRAGSIWSALNIRKVKELTAAGRMRAAGLAAFEARTAKRSGQYSYEQRPQDLIEPYAGLLRRNVAAQRFFTAQTASYRRAATWWVISAKQDATRARRAATLIGLSARGEFIPQFLAKRTAGR